MEKSKKSEPRDRLSMLPDSLIFHIFWLMPMKDVVRTPVLSKRWNKLWITSPHLNFKVSTKFKETHRIRTFVNRALICWRGIKILKFRIEFESRIKMLLYSDIDLWLRFAMDHGVEELYVKFAYEVDCTGDYYDAETPTEEGPYSVPQCLFSYPFLKVLSLTNCNLHMDRIDLNVLWNRLKVLDIKSYRFYQHWSDKIFSGSPQLEAFSLTLLDSDGNLSIRSSSLKKLHIFKYVQRNARASYEDTELTIWSPNLEILKIFGHPYCRCLLEDVPPLIHATLWMRCYYTRKDDAIEEVFRHILPAIQYVESFTLADWSLEVLADMKKKGLLSPFPNVKFLLLGVDIEDFEQIVGLLEIFPKLKRLSIQDEASKFPDHPELVNLNTDRPKSFLLELRTVDVTWTEGNYIFPFIEVLLKYASKLERMVFRVKGKKMLPAPPSESLLFASQKLLRMKRSSPNAELICCEY